MSILPRESGRIPNFGSASVAAGGGGQPPQNNTNGGGGWGTGRPQMPSGESGGGQSNGKMPENANTKIQFDKQGKHIEGHKNYDPLKNKSVLTHKDPQGLIDKYAGTGTRSNKAIGNLGEPGYQEIVDFGEPIGYHVNEESGVRMLTSKGKIHYAKNGVHIVPFDPNALIQ